MKKGVLTRIYDFFSSTRLAIFLFFIIAIASIVGTLLPQGRPEEFYVLKFGEALGKLIFKLELYDLYHSAWYNFLLFLFMLNLFLCSLKRFPVSLRLFKRDFSYMKASQFPEEGRTFLNTSLSFEKILERLRKEGFKEVRKGEGEAFFIKWKNRWGYFSVYVVHFSLFLILLGAIIGGLLGYRGNMMLIEGEMTNQVIPLKGGNPIFLDFFVKLNKFKIEFYPDGRTPKEYISYVEFLNKNKKKITNATIMVNHPYTFKGVTFYQASYDVIPEFILEIKDLKGRLIKKGVLSEQMPLIFKNYSLVLEAFRVHQNFVACKIDIFDMMKKGSPEGLIMVYGMPAKVRLGKSVYLFNITDIKEKYISGLQVKKDPGVPLVYLGFVVLIIGVVLVYYFEPQCFFAFVKDEGKERTVIFSGIAKRDRSGLKLKIKELTTKILEE